MGKNYHLIPYNFEQYDFEKFREEERQLKGEVRWPNNKRTHKVDKGDICYFYCTQMPDNIKRILLRAEVSESEIIDEDNVRCFKIHRITSIRLKDPEEASKNDDITYSYENLKTKYNINTVRGKQKLDAEGIHKELVDRLEAEPHGGSLNDVKKYYDEMTKCALRDERNPKAHDTFTKPNGFPYFEIHHVIQQKAKHKNISEKIIDDLDNKVYLCPNCHRKIHYGKPDDICTMLDKIYAKVNKAKFFKACYLEYTGKNDAQDQEVKDWLYKMYIVESV